MDDRPAFSAITYTIVSNIIFVPAIAFRLPLFWRTVAFTLLFFINLHALAHTTGDTFLNYLTGINIGNQVFTAAYLLLLSNPTSDFRHKDQKGEQWDLPIMDRLHWALSLVNGPRGIGWNYEADSRVPPRPKVTRGQFITVRTVRLVWWYILLGITQFYVTRSPIFHLEGPDARPAFSRSYTTRFIDFIAGGTASYTVQNAGYDFVSLLAVLFRFSEPNLWPPLCGSFKDSYTVRRFWGRTWHQNMRRIVSTAGKGAARCLHFPPGTFLSRYTQLYVAFIISGVMHCIGDVMVDRQNFTRSFSFFIIQAFAITFEDGVIALGRKLGIRESNATRLIGFVWFFTFMNYSMPWWYYWYVGTGLGSKPLLPGMMSKWLLPQAAVAQSV